MLSSLAPSMEHSSTFLSSQPRPTDPSHLVEYFPNFLDDDTLLDDLHKELASLKLPTVNRTGTQWLSTNLQPYTYANISHEAKPLTEEHCPTIFHIMNKINNSSLSTGHMDACLITKYSNPNVAISFHADDELDIDQDSSICTLSLGSTRIMDFCKKNW